MAFQHRTSGWEWAEAIGYYQSFANISPYLIQVKNASGDQVNLRAEDDAMGEVIESIGILINPLAINMPNNNSIGELTILVSQDAWNAQELQEAIRSLGTSVGPNNVDISGTTVLLANTLTASVR